MPLRNGSHPAAVVVLHCGEKLVGGDRLEQNLYLFACCGSLKVFDICGGEYMFFELFGVLLHLLQVDELFFYKKPEH